jgi:hypothetical protein
MSDGGLDGWGSTQNRENFSFNLCIQTGSGVYPVSYTMGTGSSFPWSKVWLVHDADHSPPSSAEVKKEKELYLLSPNVSPWHVTGPLYLFCVDVCYAEVTASSCKEGLQSRYLLE